MSKKLRYTELGKYVITQFRHSQKKKVNTAGALVTPKICVCHLKSPTLFGILQTTTTMLAASTRRAFASIPTKAYYSTAAAVQVSTAQNGIKVASMDEPGLTAGLAVVVNGGSRLESTSGVAHYLKNYGFKVSFCWSFAPTMERRQQSMQRPGLTFRTQYRTTTSVPLSVLRVKLSWLALSCPPT